MFSLFTRNYVGTFIGMLFFWLLFFGNLDMFFNTQNILTSNGIPNFVWWLLPITLFLYFWVFFIFQNRLLFWCKKVKKSLKLLFLLVSIFYGSIALMLLYFVALWYNYLLVWVWISILLAFKNIYYYANVKHKQYSWKVKIKDFFKNISIYWIILILFIAVYTRPQQSIEVPQDYFNVSLYQNKSDDNKTELFWKIQVSKYLKNIALKSDESADYSVIIYNFPQTTLDEINFVYNTSLELAEFNKNINYTFSHLISLQKVNLLKYEYEMLHKNYDEGIIIMNNILKINKNIRELNTSFIDFISYLDLHQDIVNNIKYYLLVLNEDQLETTLSNLDDIDTKTIWKQALKQEFNERLSKISQLYNVPLIIDKSEVFNTAVYIEYLKSENIDHTDVILQLKNITRKNYIWLSYLENSTRNLDDEYKKLDKLSNQIQILKNTLN